MRAEEHDDSDGVRDGIILHSNTTLFTLRLFITNHRPTGPDLCWDMVVECHSLVRLSQQIYSVKFWLK